MPEIIVSTAFKRDLKKLPAKEIEAVKSVIRILAAGEVLPIRYKNHG